MNSKISFSLTNCNRFFYLRSCYKSLLNSIKDYEGKYEIFIIDNASCEIGTIEFLNELEKNKNTKVIRNKVRSPNNEFARSLNQFVREAQGDFLLPLQGDEQFILSRWLTDYKNIFQEYHDEIGCIMIDAQRKSRNVSGRYGKIVGDKFRFVFDLQRPPISCAGSVMYSRKVIDKIKFWNEVNDAHEGEKLNSETHMLHKVRKLIETDDFIKNLKCLVPIIPPSAVIYNTKGTNARCRNNILMGEYFAPKFDDWRYYEILDYDMMVEKNKRRTIPLGIEETAHALGFKLLMDEDGNLIKNPLRIENLKPGDYIELYPEEKEVIKAEDDWLNEWTT